MAGKTGTKMIRAICIKDYYNYNICNDRFATKFKYYDLFYESVLYRLAAYDALTGFAWTPDFAGTPTSNEPGLLVSAEQFPVNNLKGPDGITYFKEVFRSYGLATSAQDSRRYPLVRIYEVIYPENIDQLSAELNYNYPEIDEEET